MPFIARVTEKYTSISADCCCLLGSYHAIDTVTFVEQINPIGTCSPALPSNAMLLSTGLCGFAEEVFMLLHNLR